MQNLLKEKLWAYIAENNPDLMFDLQEEYRVGEYLSEKIKNILPRIEELFTVGLPPYEIEQVCLKEMTAELRPSRFLYIRSVLEEEFPDDYNRLREAGLLTYEVINMMEPCKPHFEAFDFSQENEDNKHLRYAVIAEIHDYLV